MRKVLRWERRRSRDRSVRSGQKRSKVGGCMGCAWLGRSKVGGGRKGLSAGRQVSTVISGGTGRRAKTRAAWVGAGLPSASHSACALASGSAQAEGPVSLGPVAAGKAGKTCSKKSGFFFLPATLPGGGDRGCLFVCALPPATDQGGAERVSAALLPSTLACHYLLLVLLVDTCQARHRPVAGPPDSVDIWRPPRRHRELPFSGGHHHREPVGQKSWQPLLPLAHPFSWPWYYADKSRLIAGIRNCLPRASSH